MMATSADNRKRKSAERDAMDCQQSKRRSGRVGEFDERLCEASPCVLVGYKLFREWEERWKFWEVQARPVPVNPRRSAARRNLGSVITATSDLGAFVCPTLQH